LRNFLKNFENKFGGLKQLFYLCTPLAGKA